jgi:hypothetical protein
MVQVTWASMCSTPAVFVLGRDRGKLSYFWRHAYGIACSGRHQGSVINPDSGAPVIIGEAEEFPKKSYVCGTVLEIILDERLAPGSGWPTIRQFKRICLWR